MRVAYVCADRGVPVFGRKGSSIHVMEVVRHLRRAGADVEIFATRTGGDPPRELRDVRVAQLPREPGDDGVMREQAALKANNALRAELERRGPFDVVYERHALWSYAGMEHARDGGAAALLEVNAPLLDEQRRYRELHHECAAKEAVGRAYGAASALLAVSEGVARHLRGHPAVVAPIHVVPNGVDPERFAATGAPGGNGSADGLATVGFVGTLKPWHGVAGLVEAAARLDRDGAPVRLLVVGEGPQREALEAQARAAGIADRVDFRGAVDPADMPWHLAEMEVAVAPYPPLDDFYFSPLKIFEYMAASRAIVAAAVGQITDLLEDGETAVLYPADDVPALARAIGGLAADPDRRARLGAAARRAAVARHTWQAVADRILAIARAPGKAPGPAAGGRS
jgi:glycosyltransferase involved in cell wall biosynthesis